MRKTNQGNEKQVTFTPLTTDNEGLQACLGCGLYTALKIGEAAGAKVMVGKRVLWNLQKIQRYLDSISM